MTPSVSPANPRVSVVIPVWNGGKLLHRCIEQVLSQEFEDAFELVVIDSESTDGSREWLRERAEREPRLRVHEIRSADFGHGRTRNLGASLARGNWIAFLTQDAVPADRQWLRSLRRAADAHPRAAGVFGRHRAWPEHGVLMERGMDAFFDGFGSTETVFELEDRQRYQDDVAYRQRLHFYSDNNSMLKRSVWEDIPYPDVEFGEDQLWARTIIEAGYAKVYASGAVVYHSHRYPFRQSYRRAREEAVVYFHHFGYRLGNALRPSLREAWRKTRGDWAELRRLRPGKVTWGERMRIASDSYALFLGHWAAWRRIRRARGR